MNERLFMNDEGALTLEFFAFFFILVAFFLSDTSKEAARTYGYCALMVLALFVFHYLMKLWILP